MKAKENPASFFGLETIVASFYSRVKEMKAFPLPTLGEVDGKEEKARDESDKDEAREASDKAGDASDEDEAGDASDKDKDTDADWE